MKRLLLTIIVLAFASATYAGGVGNGGDKDAQDFVTSAQDGYGFLVKHHSQFPFIDLVKVQAAITAAKVDVLEPGSHFTDAVRTAENFPDEGKIKLDGDRWEKIGEPTRKMALALHEYLGLTGYEVNNYIITSQLFGIMNDQMETPPTIDELNHSFDSVRQRYTQLLNYARTLRADAIYVMPKSLTRSECETVVKTEIANPNIVKKFDDENICAAGTVLFEQSDVTSLGLKYRNILSHTETIYRTSPSGHLVTLAMVSHYFIGAAGKIVERIEERPSDNTDRCPLDTPCMMLNSLQLLNKDGDAYGNSTQISNGAERAISEETASVVLGDGSLGSDLEFYKIYPGGLMAPRTTMKFSTADLADWQNFGLELINLDTKKCEASDSNQCAWGEVAHDLINPFGAMSVSYQYLGQPSWRPTNMRAIEYGDTGERGSGRSGLYVSGGREYQIDEK